MNRHLLQILTTFFILLPVCLSAQTIGTVAGTGTGGYSGDGKKATNAMLHWPQGLAIDKQGRLLIADTWNNRIRRVDGAGQITTLAGTGYLAGTGKGNYNGDEIAATAADLYNPGGVAVDTAGNIFFADTYNNRVRMIDTGGKIHTVAGTGVAGFGGDNAAATAAKLNEPSRVAVDTFGNLYIADPQNNRVRKVSVGGTITTFAGTGTPTYTGDGGPAAAATLMSPSDVAADKLGNVYIVDQQNNALRLVKADGTISTYAGDGIPAFYGDGGPSTASRMYNPAAVALDDSGNVYITDHGNECIRKVSKATGIITTITGTGISDSAGYRGDGGPATAAWLDYPEGIVVNSKGTVYIADMNNNRIRAVGGKTEGIKNLNGEVGSLSMSPNPSAGACAIAIPAAAGKEQAILSVYNVTGALVYSTAMSTGTSKEIQLAAGPGVYQVTATASGKTWTGTLVLTR